MTKKERSKITNALIELLNAVNEIENDTHSEEILKIHIRVMNNYMKNQEDKLNANA